MPSRKIQTRKATRGAEQECLDNLPIHVFCSSQVRYSHMQVALRYHRGHQLAGQTKGKEQRGRHPCQ